MSQAGGRDTLYFIRYHAVIGWLLRRSGALSAAPQLHHRGAGRLSLGSSHLIQAKDFKMISVLAAYFLLCLKTCGSL